MPDEDDPSCATIWVDVRIGADRVQFVVDSGARRSRTSIHVADTWHVLGADRSDAVFSHHSDLLVAAPPLQLGDVLVENLEMSRIPSGTPGAQNLLGVDVLCRHSCLLDLEARTLTLDGSMGTTAPLMPLFLDEAGHAYLDVVMGSVTASAVDGALKRSGHFEAGEPVGEWTTYDHDGAPYKVTVKGGGDTERG